MPPHWDSDAAWYPTAPGQSGHRYAGEQTWSGGLPPGVRLWVPVIVSFLVQVPAIVLLTWPGRDSGLAGWVLTVVLAAAGPVALIGARRFPGQVVAVAAGSAGALLLLHPDLDVPPVALAFAIVLGIGGGARVWVYTTVVSTWVATIALASILNLELHPLRVAFTTLALTLLMGVGEFSRSRQDRLGELRRSASALRIDAEQKERVRIAWELHDVVARSLSQINAQAQLALQLIDVEPDRAAQALSSITATSTTALEEVRMVLGILRSNDEVGLTIDVATEFGQTNVESAR
ncbi:histidine kinase dimerization/phosphoacceptor domain-containing protein [Cryobacterium sp. CG_9.6]|uniref:sensor histidine kinase n=1 Tax=Cryobacterium sp. CG_9.6 TaxID=2760710 RepID=UPI0024758007|nr:histidine kinase dimerization/phosphoacceptor domain-containing protein [Cryobacterium sp. CG_9.6]MDH6236495.1 signal transduction histidine kinase [Cryobacterium sp. CG_9.6]